MRRVLCVAALALLPVIIALFAIGDGTGHTWADRVAVLCVIAQSGCVLAALRDITVSTVPLPAGRPNKPLQPTSGAGASS